MAAVILEMGGIGLGQCLGGGDAHIGHLHIPIVLYGVRGNDSAAGLIQQVAGQVCVFCLLLG